MRGGTGSFLTASTRGAIFLRRRRAVKTRTKNIRTTRPISMRDGQLQSLAGGGLGRGVTIWVMAGIGLFTPESA